MALALCLIAFGALAADQGSRHHARGDYDSSAATYVVAKGDDLIQIARRFETTVAALKAENGLSSNEIMAGQTLMLASAASVPGFRSLIPSAEARVGRPLTPVSVAGVGRRTVRRCAVGVYDC